MGPLALDPETALQFHEIVLYCIAYVFAGAALIGLSIYGVLLCSEMFSPQTRSKARLASLPHPVGCAPVAEENLDLSAAETPVVAEGESLGGEAVPAPALPHAAQMPMTLVPVTLESEPTGPWGFLTLPEVSGGSGPPEAPAEVEG